MAKRNVTISARIPAELNDALRALAQGLGREPSWVIAEALRRYVATEGPFIAAVAEGMREFEAGDVVPHEEVVAMLEARRRQLRRPDATRGADSERSEESAPRDFVSALEERQRLIHCRGRSA